MRTTTARHAVTMNVRILFTTTGHTGHLLPLLPFAHAAARAGHDVLVATQRSRLAAVERAGVAGAPFTDAPPERWRPILQRVAALPVGVADALVLRDGFADVAARSALPDLLALADAWRPDVIVRESFEFAGGLVAEARGIPLARLGLGLEQSEEWATAHAAPAVDALRAGLGLAPDPAGAALRRAPYLTLVPAAFEVPETRRARPGAPLPRGTARAARRRRPATGRSSTSASARSPGACRSSPTCTVPRSPRSLRSPRGCS